MTAVLELYDKLASNPWLFALVVFAAAVLLSWLVGNVVIVALRKLAARSHNPLDDAIINQIKMPLEFTIFLGGGALAVQHLIGDAKAGGQFTSAILSVIVLTWTIVAARISRTIFNYVIKTKKGTSGFVQAAPLLSNLILVVLWANAVYWLMNLWQVDVTPLLASAGIVTAAVALASKDTLANFFGGVSVFVDRPYKLGDYVVLGSGERGEVVNIGVRSTRILTRDDVLITIPNASIANSKIVNQSGQVPRYRIRASVGVGYDSDPDQVEQVLLGCCQDIPEILPSPTPRVRFRSFGDSALDYQLMFWVNRPGDRGRILHLVNRNILLELRKAGIEIPFPQRVVYLPKAGE